MVLDQVILGVVLGSVLGKRPLFETIPLTNNVSRRCHVFSPDEIFPQEGFH